MAAITGSMDNGYTVLYPSGIEITYFTIESEYEIDAVPGRQAYSVKVRCRLVTNNAGMRFTSSLTKLYVYCNEQVLTEVGDPTMDIWAPDYSYTDGPWCEWFTFTYPVDEKKSTINLRVMLDLSAVTGVDSKDPGGPDCNSRPGEHYNKMYNSATVNVDGIVLGEKPTLTSISNNNPYDGDNSISENMYSIQIAINGDWGDPKGTAHWSCGSKSGTTSNTSFSITNLDAGTTYTIAVYIENSMGKSDTKTIEIRTRYEPPNLTVALLQRDMERLIFEWTSDKPLQRAQYKLDEGDWKNVDVTAGSRSGNFTVQWLEPNSAHTITFRGRSTTDFDFLLGDEVSDTGRTLNYGRVTNVGACIFGQSIELEISKVAEYPTTVRVWVSDTASFNIGEVENGTHTWTPTQAQLDAMYKCFPNDGNTMAIHFQATTEGLHDSYDDSQKNRTYTLTGIAKTAHVGVNNRTRRCQIWVGVNGKARRCVGWVGVNNAKRRTI